MLKSTVQVSEFEDVSLSCAKDVRSVEAAETTSDLTYAYIRIPE